MRLVVVRGKGSGSGLRSRHVISTGQQSVVVVADVDVVVVVVGCSERDRDQRDSAHSTRRIRGQRLVFGRDSRLIRQTDGRQWDSLSNRAAEPSCRDLSPTEQAA